MRLLALLLAALASAVPNAQDALRPGPQPDGSILLPSGWSLRPHGEQVPLDLDLPVRLALHPGGRFLAVQHAGYREHAVALFDLDQRKVTARLPLGKSWSGMAWGTDGRRLYVGGGVDDDVEVFAFDAGHGTAQALGTFPVGDPARLDLVAGMCLDGAGRLFVCLQRSDRLVRLGNLGEQDLEVELPAGSMPFECAAADGGGTIWVSLWARAEAWAIDAASGGVLARVATGPHPSGILVAPDGARVFVSDANANTVTVIDAKERRVQETLSSALWPGAPPGSTPNALALGASGKELLVANADNDDLAVIDVSAPGKAHGLGFVPVGEYPTAVVVRPGTGEVIVANGKGSVGSRANPEGPQPGKRAADDQYTGGMFLGSLSLFPLPDEDELRGLTANCYRDAPLAEGAAVRGLSARPVDSPIPAKVGDPSPIRHCVYVIKENRTYDQVLGDMEEGDGDADLCLFPEQVTPNHHAIARGFVLLDGFYVAAEVSADGHEWSMGAYASDFVERTWPVTYGGKGTAELVGGEDADLGYPSEGNFDVATPASGYLFDLAQRAGISYRSYGEFVANEGDADEDDRAGIASLVGHFDPGFHGWDLGYRDVDRAERFLAELQRFEQEGDFPALVVLRLPNDHTSGTSLGRPTPRAYVADNDLALGMVLQGLSRSSFWGSMAVFVVEDDAQSGPDHVDAHRSVALVAGPYVKRGAVVHTMYSTCSMLRTIELVLGLPPMSQFDAAARPMFECFTGTPDPTPYELRPATWPLDEVNLKTSWGTERSEHFDLSREDAVDDLALNEVIWKAIRGADSPLPPPRRAAFVRAGDGD